LSCGRNPSFEANSQQEDINMTDEAPSGSAATAMRGGNLTRRALTTVALGAGMAAGLSPGAAQSAPVPAFGAPVVEVSVPGGLLSSEQKGDMIKRITDVVLSALNLPPDPQRHMFVAVVETAESGFGVDGKVFVPGRR